MRHSTLILYPRRVCVNQGEEGQIQEKILITLSELNGDQPKRSTFKSYPIVYLHADIAEVRTDEGKRYLFVAIGRKSKFACVRLEKMPEPGGLAPSSMRSWRQCITAFIPCGIQFAALPKHCAGPTALLRGHPFDRACQRHSIEYRLTLGRMGKWSGCIAR